MKKIIIIDIDIGNVLSIERAIKYLGYHCKISNNLNDLISADALILPGDGAFGDTMKQINKRKLIKPILNHISANKLILGICVGMQIFGTYSEEFGYHQGLNLIPGKIVKFPISKSSSNTFKIPHLGWNNLNRPKYLTSWNNSILNKIKENDCVYFIHSYLYLPDNKKYIVATTNYANIEYACVIRKNNIIGCQFHPEKSGKTGLTILNNFLKMI